MATHDESFAPIPLGEYDDGSLRGYLKQYGLTLSPEEARRVGDLLGRDPTLTEMTLFDTMWSEHCSYKSSRPHLKAHLPTTGNNVVVGPVEDAGIVDFGEIDGKKFGIIFAHESHNHPSQVMPVEGAATGIGGIVRDVYCMGGEVIATLDPLRFGWPVEGRATEGSDGNGPDAAHRIEIAREVVAGIWEYGNAIGVPNLGGDVYFHPSFNENCLVNVVAVGLVEHDHITHSAVPKEAAEEPYDLILVGKPTDWSGMGGAAFASATLDAASAKENKGSVQTPDPFLKRMLTVANREVLRMVRAEGVEIGFKDLGAGGVSCVTSELADAGGFGCDVDVQLVHQITDLPARVCACSETQERYGLAVPARLTDKVLRIYNEDFALPTLYEGACARKIGVITHERQYVLRWGDQVLCQAPIETITEGIRYDRPTDAPDRPEVPAELRLPEAGAEQIALEWLELLGHPNVASREYIYRHYDSEVQAGTILRPGEADAGVIAPVPGSRRAVALSADGNPLLGLADPYSAGAAAVLEVCRNVACVGGEPAAVTDCLNFGNPEVPRSFWEFTEAVRGVGDACRGVGCYALPNSPLPVVSGNVSFYNQSSSGRSVAPSPIVACVAIVEDYSLCRSQRFKETGEVLLQVGARSPEMAGSLYIDAGFQAGRPAVPGLDFDTARAEIRAVIDLVKSGLVTAAHDISDGGLAICLSEMAMGLEGAAVRGARIQVPEGQGHLSLREFLFSEAGGFVVTVSETDLEAAESILEKAGADWWRLGQVNDSGRIEVLERDGTVTVDLDVLQMMKKWQTALPALLAGAKAAEAVPFSTGNPGAEDAPDYSSIQVALGRSPRVAVVQLPGVNCEQESARTLVMAGAEAEVFRWTLPPAELSSFDGFLIPGGFSYQDRVRAGAVAAKDPLLRVLLEEAEAGKPILGICNGCQVLVEAGLVPGLTPGSVEVALAANRFPGRRGYYSRWIAVEPAVNSTSPFVEGLVGTVPLPIAHAEGRFTHEDPEFFTKLDAAGHVALRYVPVGPGCTTNPNGSILDVAGLTNQQGNVLAMMPHPERAAQLRHVPEDLPHAWGRARSAAAGDFQTLETPGPGAFLLRRLVEMC
ncbi:MAG: phosphoribosylformylglycinamidine synthase subunit PurL [Gemmatimonadales bacterium]|nr:phosphoribosylformylglycinamidine synthase subunit PurL [Gemmatimonadales bacterium]